MRKRYLFKTFYCPDEHKTHKFVEDNTEWVLCEHPGCAFAATLPAIMKGLSASVHGDEVDYIDHNLGPEPIRIRSMSQRRAIMAATGRQEFIRHTPVPGTDKSPHTTDWSKGSIDPQTLENARVLVERQGGIRHFEDETVEEIRNPIRGIGNDAFNKLVKEYHERTNR